MSRILELPDPVYQALQEVASASGLTPAGWIAAHLPEARVAQNGTAEKPARTLAERFAGRVGRIAGSGPESLSENTGDRFAEYVEAKHRAGRL